MIKFVKAGDCVEVKTNKVKTARKSSVRYAKMYRNTSKSPKDSGCSQHMTGNISYLSDYEPYDGGYVSFGQGGGKITSKGRDFKLNDDTNVLLRTPRQHNMYSIDLNNIVPHKDLTCLVVKASVDDNMLWHRRLGHLNFKTMNKLVRHNLVKGLPSKCFENDHTCVACLKEKQHKASCKTKLVNSVSKTLHTLHTDLFRPTSVSSLNHKWYCLVVTDDFFRFTWTLFLKTKDETSGILRNFITEIENLKELKVKIIRCDNGGTSSTNFSGTKDVASQDVKKDVSSLRYIALPNWFHEAHLETSTSNAQDTCNVVAPESSGNFNPTATSKNPPADQMEKLTVKSTIPNVSSPVPTACLDDSPEPSSATRLISKRVTSQDKTPSPDNISTLSNRFKDILGVSTNTVDTNGVEADLSNIESIIPASPTLTFRIHKDHPKSQIIEPKKISDALKDPSWVEAMQEGLLQFKIQNVWILVDCPKWVRPIGTKWVLKNKKDERGIMIKNKARLVAQGHTQEERIDYEEVFAPLSRIEAIRLFLAYASFIGFTFPGRVYKAEKEMYGLHQDPRAWYGTLSKYFLANGFQRGTIDQTLFIKKHRGDFLLTQVYVDDIIFGSSNSLLCIEFEALMHDKFQMSAMGELNFFLGLQVLQKKDDIFLSQDKYVGDILKKFRYLDVRSANILMDKENPW
nr:hypothetical protein [Tanacetum cinerariifolium]